MPNSLSAYSPEELYVRKQLVDDTPDVVVNVLDASNIERNLYLTTQLMDMHLRVVCALNMYDELELRGDKLNVDKLSSLLGMPMVPTSFKTGRGLDQLLSEVIHIFESREGHDQYYRHFHIKHDHEIEDGITNIQKYLKDNTLLRMRYSTRWLAIKLMEMDKEVDAIVRELPDYDKIIAARDMAVRRIKEETGDDSETAIMDAKYGFIRGALHEAGYVVGVKGDTYKTTHKLDALITNRWVGFPIFFFILYLMFEATFILGQYPMDWIEMGVDELGGFIGESMAEGPLKAMLIDGVIGGVGSVIVFLPQILILYTFISFMEDSGYMARAAFIMDKLMHGMREPSFAPDYHAGAANDVVLCAPTYLHNDNGCFLYGPLSESGNDITLCRWNRAFCCYCPCVEQMGYQGRGYAFCDGAAPLSLPHGEGHLPPYVGEG